ncbi:hypothetical protein HKD37_18G050362 [Glycine soja]
MASNRKKQQLGSRWRRRLAEEAQALLGLGLSTKKLRRLLHVFRRVLNLPFLVDVDVSVQEASPTIFDSWWNPPSLAKWRPTSSKCTSGSPRLSLENLASSSTLDELHLDVWRMRLLESMRLELATIVLVAGELVIMVPKNQDVWVLHSSLYML